MLHCPGWAATVMLAGQVTAGGWLSITVTVNEQVDVLPLPSVAVAMTVVVPRGKTVPLAGSIGDASDLAIVRGSGIELHRLPAGADNIPGAGEYGRIRIHLGQQCLTIRRRAAIGVGDGNAIGSGEEPRGHCRACAIAPLIGEWRRTCVGNRHELTTAAIRAGWIEERGDVHCNCRCAADCDGVDHFTTCGVRDGDGILPRRRACQYGPPSARCSNGRSSGECHCSHALLQWMRCRRARAKPRSNPTANR